MLAARGARPPGGVRFAGSDPRRGSRRRLPLPAGARPRTFNRRDAVTITKENTTRLLGELVCIESVTPWLIPDGSGERAVAEAMAAWLADLPLEISLDEIEPGRVNLVARLRGSGGGPTLCINAHADTVGFANWCDRALEPRVDADRMIGLGAADDKSCCAAGMLALRSLVETG